MSKKIVLLILALMSVLSANAQSRIYNAYGYYSQESPYDAYEDEVYYYRGGRRVYVAHDGYAVVRRPYVMYERPAVVERIIERPVVVEKPVVAERPIIINNNIQYQEVEPYDKAFYIAKRNVRSSNADSFGENVATQWTLVFNIGSYGITTAALPDLDNIKKFYNTYPDCTFEILAYADRGTGTSAGNMILSRNRGNSIMKYLNEMHGIPYSKMFVDCYGSGRQAYPNNDWNRCVIVRACFER